MNTIKIHILRRLYDHTYIGRRHCSIQDLRQGLPSHKRDMKVIEENVKELINETLLIPYKVGRVSLNPHKLSKIKDIIG